MRSADPNATRQAPRSAGPTEESVSGAAIIVLDMQGVDVARCGGVGRYATRLQSGLKCDQGRQALANSNVIVINASPPASTRMWIKRPVARAFNVLLRFSGFSPGEVFRPLAFPDELSRLEPNAPLLFHEISNHNVNAGLFRLERSHKLRLCVTVIDVLSEALPDGLSNLELMLRHQANLYYRQRADTFFAISNHARDEFCERFDCPPERVIVTPLAADDIHDARPGSNDLRFARSLGRFVFYPAKAWPHKNHGRLIQALARQRNLLRQSRLQLVLVGGFRELERRSLKRAASAAGVTDLVTILGFVSVPRYRALLEHAEGLVFPSLYEGFGLPVLEAMEVGCPVASSGAGALGEVTGLAAITFDPMNVDEIANVIGDFARGVIDREGLAIRGRQNARRYRWDQTIRRTIENYRQLL